MTERQTAEPERWVGVREAMELLGASATVVYRLAGCDLLDVRRDSYGKVIVPLQFRSDEVMALRAEAERDGVPVGAATV
jgi:hypothetical protein